jgi:glycosyltransferase involved in cell wall biosynthesis
LRSGFNTWWSPDLYLGRGLPGPIPDRGNVGNGSVQWRGVVPPGAIDMINGKKVVVVMPAYNAESTLEQTYSEIPLDVVDEVVLVDDGSHDSTVEQARRLGIKHLIVHDANRGYGANQKTCYQKALSLDADIIIMLHPDYQYTPKLIPAMAYIIANGLYPVVLGSRILGNGALRGGMPYYKYVANRFLTLFQNLLLNAKLSEYHTGYRAFSREVLQTINYAANSDDFVFDNEILSQILYAGFEIAEVTCPTSYFTGASSINLRRSIYYGLGVLAVSFRHFLQRCRIAHFEVYSQKSPSGS